SLLQPRDIRTNMLSNKAKILLVTLFIILILFATFLRQAILCIQIRNPKDFNIYNQLLSTTYAIRIPFLRSTYTRQLQTENFQLDFCRRWDVQEKTLFCFQFQDTSRNMSSAPIYIVIVGN